MLTENVDIGKNKKSNGYLHKKLKISSDIIRKVKELINT